MADKWWALIIMILAMVAIYDIIPDIINKRK
jgi:hypothetical protein